MRRQPINFFMVKPKKNQVSQIQSPKGMHDILPVDQPIWEKIRRTARETAEAYNFCRLDTPILEKLELFERGVGEATDIVEKQMFVLTTKGKERLALRPEATAALARSYIQHGLSQLGQPVKIFSHGPRFRYEQPQAGRYRQFHQIDFDIISNEDDPIYDAQVILAFCRLLAALKIKNLKVVMNSIGCKNCRPPYKRELQNYYKNLKSDLCPDCLRRLDINPLRLLDCKEEKCQELKKNVPIIIDHLCVHCHNHFKMVLEYLDELSLPYNLDHHLVRGLDYYTKTVFEIVAEGVDFSLAGGGRYDYLIELLGGKNSPAVGGAMGVERIFEIIKSQNINLGLKVKQKVFLIHIGELAKRKSLTLLETLRKADIHVTESLGKESLKSQLRAADKFGSPLALIFGQKEAFEETVMIRDLKSGVQETVPLKKLAETIKKKLH